MIAAHIVREWANHLAQFGFILLVLLVEAGFVQLHPREFRFAFESCF